MRVGPGAFGFAYTAVHAIVKWAFLLGIVLPAGLAFAAAWYLCFPVGVLMGLAVCDDAEEFASGIRERYVEMPADFWRAFIEEFSV